MTDIANDPQRTDEEFAKVLASIRASEERDLVRHLDRIAAGIAEGFALAVRYLPEDDADRTDVEGLKGLGAAFDAAKGLRWDVAQGTLRGQQTPNEHIRAAWSGGFYDKKRLRPAPEGDESA